MLDKKDMVILVLSCDKNEELFEPFRVCLEENWGSHPKVIYATETIRNPYYETICFDFPLSQWTKRIRKTLECIQTDKILIMIDDLFIRKPVTTDRIEYALDHLTGNIACFNFEKSFDEQDMDVGLEGFLKRKLGSSFEVSIFCGLWDKQKLYNVLDRDCDPWTIEEKQDNKGYEYYINSGDYIIDWGYKTWNPTGVFKGKWMPETVDFLKSKGIEVDFSKKGVHGHDF